jgi:hypothetical protein
MTRDGWHRLVGLRMSALVGSAVLTIALACATAASAVPTGELAVFKECPIENPAVTSCVYAESLGGEFHFGKTTVPISKTIILQGGTAINEETGEETFVPALNGESLSKTPLEIPGGLFGTTPPRHWPGHLKRLFGGGLGRVTATVEVVGQVGISRLNLIFGHGIALELPIRLHLRNPFLGNSCYIGSPTNPVVQHLTTGETNPPPPNVAIKGLPGELEGRDEGRILVVKNNLQVDNSYAAPGAEGCGGFFSFLVDPLINARLGLPSPAGTNTTQLRATLENTTPAAIKSSEEEA